MNWHNRISCHHRKVLNWGCWGTLPKTCLDGCLSKTVSSIVSPLGSNLNIVAPFDWRCQSRPRSRWQNPICDSFELVSSSCTLWEGPPGWWWIWCRHLCRVRREWPRYNNRIDAQYPRYCKGSKRIRRYKQSKTLCFRPICSPCLDKFTPNYSSNSTSWHRGFQKCTTVSTSRCLSRLRFRRAASATLCSTIGNHGWLISFLSPNQFCLDLFRSRFCHPVHLWRRANNLCNYPTKGFWEFHSSNKSAYICLS